MKERKISEGRLSQKGHGLGTVTEAMVQRRAEELAVINGRTAQNVLSSDVEQARRELMGQTGPEGEASASEQLPEESRWQPVAESTGKKAPTVPASDEQTFAEKLVEEGVEEAEHDQMNEATRASLERDRDLEP
jgi:hypothetical protein